MFSKVIIACVCLQVSWIFVSCENSNYTSCVGVDASETRFCRRKVLELNADFDNLSHSGIVLPDYVTHDEADLVNPWYTNVPLLPIVFATSPTLPHGPCKKQAIRYLKELKNGTLWATQMYDSSTKYPDGLISGHTRHFGDFDGCYNLKAELQNYDNGDWDEEISGRYCLVDIQYEKPDLPPLKPDERHELEFDPNGSTWEAIREKGDFRRVKRYLLQMALCVPEVCSASDIEAALQAPIKQFALDKQLNVEVSVKPHFCQALKDVPKFSQSAKIYCYIVGSLIALVIIATIYDFNLSEYNEDVTSATKDLMLCFSARRNFNTIMERTTGHPGLEAIHLMRFFYLTLTMVGHRTVEYFTGPVVNVSYMEWLYKFKQSMIVLAGPQVVESFFAMGGLLLTYGLLTELDKRKTMNFVGPIIIRFLRLTPSYMLIVFFNALLLPYLGSGPYWEWKVGLERDSCSNNWWANFLYINNYVNPEMMCMFQSWYLSVDYHLYIIALVVIYVFWQMPRKYGYALLVTVILSGCIVPFFNTYSYGVQPLYKGLLYMQEVRYDPYITDHYVKTHERITSYFIGVLFGAVIYDHTRAPWRLGKLTSNILFIIFVVVLSLGSQISGHKFYDPNSKTSAFEAALYACLHRGLFAIATCAIPALITFGDGLNFHYNFLTPRWVQPWARLTYGAYLIHTVLQLYQVGITRSARSFGIQNMFWDFIPDVVFVFFLSLLLALVIEGPFRRIEKRFIMRREKIARNINNNMTTEVKKAN